MDGDTPGRGRDAVEAALIESTATLLAEQGPARIGLREIAERAGVNKGQIHHYFGSKQNLIEAAVRKLAREHYDNATERAGGPMPVPLTLGLDTRYWQTIIRLILNGDLDTAGLEFDEGISVPQRALDELAKNDGEASVELKAAVAGAMALELGWTAFQDFILRAVRAESPDEVAAIEAQLRRRLEARPPKQDR